MCDDGRFGWKYVHGEDRLTSPRLGKATQAQALVGASASGQGNGKANSTVGTFAPPADLQFADPWPEVLQAVRAKFEEASKKSAQKCLALFSPFMTVEEAYLLAAYLKDVDKGIVLAMGPIPVVGEDDCYPKDHKGRPPAPEKVRFTIRAEKCPNRRGVEAVLKHFQGEVIDFAQARERIQRGSVEAALIVGGYEQTDVWDSAFLASVQSLATLVVIDFRRSALTDQADILLAGATFAEREGTVVNHAGLAQSLRPRFVRRVMLDPTVAYGWNCQDAKDFTIPSHCGKRSHPRSVRLRHWVRVNWANLASRCSDDELGNALALVGRDGYRARIRSGGRFVYDVCRTQTGGFDPGSRRSQPRGSCGAVSSHR